MLRILNREHYEKMWNEAERNGSFESFRKNLEYLHTYGGLKDPEYIRVSLGHPFGHTGLSVLWERRNGDGEYKEMMDGGLVYFENGNEWSVHT